MNFPSFSGSFKASCVGVALLSLAGCMTDEAFQPAPSSRFIKTTTPKASEAPPPIVVPKTKVAKAEPQRDYPEPTVLTGLTAENVTTLLGTPGFKRADDPAEIWQYRVERCTLDLFMYETLDSKERSVAHFETRGQDGESISTKDCFVDVIKAAEAAPQTS